MTAFRLAIAAYVAILLGYTAIVIANHGMGLLPIFFGDIAKMEWPGQFNLDFMGFILLTAFWVAWRNGFTLGGLALALLVPAGGIGFTGLYLIYLSYQTKGDVKAMLMGVQAR
jgi:hypothetical protein